MQCQIKMKMNSKIILSCLFLISIVYASDIEPFRMRTINSSLFDLETRLWNWKPFLNNEFDTNSTTHDWNYGVEMKPLKELLEYWRSDFIHRWLDIEETLSNEMPQFKTKVDGLTVHFVHVRSTNQSAIPLLISHGWPGSFYEFRRLIPLLTNRFHLVMPSIPGFGYSESPKSSGWGPSKVGDLFTSLMKKLKYDQFVVQGGDWGSVIATQMALRHPQEVIGIHINMLTILAPELNRGFVNFVKSLWLLATDSNARAQLGYALNVVVHESGYFHEQMTKPHTIGAALSDSPAGLAAYFLEKFQSWTHKKNNENVFSTISKDDLLTNIMIYWTTNTITSSMRIYYEAFRTDLQDNSWYVERPSCFAAFRDIFGISPRACAEFGYNIVHYSQPERGGHFAAMEVPDLLAKDIVSCVDVMIQPKQTSKQTKTEV